MEWSNEMVMEFLDLYEGEPVIWNPNYPQHKDRNHVYDAWKRIEAKLSCDCSFKELKKKKENLMATYRKLALKVKKSKITGTGSNEVFKPEWFAYDRMGSFLHSIYTPRRTKDTERPENEFDNEEDVLNDDEVNALESSSVSSASDKQVEGSATETTEINEGGPPAGKKRKAEKIAIADKRMDEAYAYLKQVAATPKVVKDEVYMFCELLGLKLRALDEETREAAMLEINNMMYYIKKRKIQQSYTSLQQPGYFQTYNVAPLQPPDYGSHQSSSYISPSNSVATPQSVLSENGGVRTAADLVSNCVEIQ